MKLGPTGKRAGGAAVNPFEAMQEANTQPAGAGTGVPRKRPGVGKPESAKRVRPFSQALGDTPPRDGPFADMARTVAKRFPPKTRVNQARRKTSGLNPKFPGGGV